MMTLGLTNEEKPALIRLLRKNPPRLDPAEGADRADHPKPDAAELSAHCGAAGATPQRLVQRDQTSA